MTFAEKVYYCTLDNFFLSKEDAENKGFHIEGNYIVFLDGERFKVITECGPSGWPVIEVHGEEIDFARDEPVKVRLYD